MNKYRITVEIIIEADSEEEAMVVTADRLVRTEIGENYEILEVSQATTALFVA